MIIFTTEGSVEVFTAPNDLGLDRVRLASEDQHVLKSVLASLELAGVSEDPTDVLNLDSMDIEQVLLTTGKLGWELELDRTTFLVWFNFEVLHYLQYGRDEFCQVLNQSRGKIWTDKYFKVLDILQ